MSRHETDHNDAHASAQNNQPTNPKLNPVPGSNTEKDPDNWTTGSEPMTGAQASYLKTLTEEANEPEMFDASLDKAEASKRIDQLKQMTGK